MAVIFQLVVGFPPSAKSEAEAAVELASTTDLQVRGLHTTGYSAAHVGWDFVPHGSGHTNTYQITYVYAFQDHGQLR